MRYLLVLLLLGGCTDTRDPEAAKARAQQRAVATAEAAKEACRARGQEVFDLPGGEWVCGAAAKARRDARESEWRARCEAEGKQLYRGGLQGFYCASPTSDAGAECRTGADCQSFCLLRVEGDRRGYCAPASVVPGCFLHRGANGYEGTTCVDI